MENEFNNMNPEDKESVFEPIDFDIYFDINSDLKKDGKIISSVSERYSKLQKAYNDKFFKDYCSHTWKQTKNYPESQELYNFILVLGVNNNKKDGNDEFIRRVFELLFDDKRIQGFSDDYFLRVIFYSSPNNMVLNQALGGAVRPESRYKYSQESTGYFSNYEKDSINAMKEIINNVLIDNGLQNDLVENEYEIILGNKQKAKSISIADPSEVKIWPKSY